MKSVESLFFTDYKVLHFQQHAFEPTSCIVYFCSLGCTNYAVLQSLPAERSWLPYNTNIINLINSPLRNIIFRTCWSTNFWKNEHNTYSEVQWLISCYFTDLLKIIWKCSPKSINPAKPEYRNMCPKFFFYSYLR